jgi:ATP-dependent helicase/nuclease subunit B
MANEAPVFGAGRPKVWSIPPGADFLLVLANTLAQETGLSDQPDALSDAIIYVPNSRSARALTLALFDAAGGKPILPPDIRTLGDLESEEAPPNAETALAGLPPAMSAARRLGALANLVRRYYAAQYQIDLPPASAIAAARELARLLDQAALSDAVDWSKLEGLVEQSDLASHWHGSVKFLKIITEAWPDWLAANNAMDPFARRLAAAKALAADWVAKRPAAPVVIAGSTGATPAGRVLMKAVLELPSGLIVLPGLDTDADGEAWDAIRLAVSHPQNALIDALDHLRVLPGDVGIWPGIPQRATDAARRRMIHEALAPADATADWRDTLKTLANATGSTVEGFAEDALDGLIVIEAPDEAAEAEAAALLMREALETPGETAALVTPDAGLARRVSALLKRWGVDVPPSAGVPLGRTQAGSLIGLCASWAIDPSEPVALTAAMKHAFVKDREGLATLERHFLRGPRRWRDLAGLRASIDTRDQIEPYASFERPDQDEAVALVDRLIVMFAETGADLSGRADVDGAQAAEQIAALAGRIGDAPLPWAGEDGRKASDLFVSIREISDQLGLMPPRALVELIHAQSAQMTVSAGLVEHPRLTIWGPLEARLQSAGLVILAGLNEDVWPHRPSPDAFLPRRFRAELGLNDPEDRLGLSAHDFAQLACAPKVVMLYAARRDDAPAVASRWVWRLKTLAEGALDEKAAEALAPENGHPLDWVAAMQARGTNSLPEDYSAEPRPTLHPDGWPKRLSVTRIDLLQRDPYAMWSENVLGLSPLDPMNAPLGPAPRGTAIHHALELLEEDSAPKTAAHLMELLAHELSRVGEPEEDWAARRAVWQRTVDWYLSWRAGRDTGGAKPKLEVNGRLEFDIAGYPFILSANADRIERTAIGELVIVDFKTGSPPSDKEIAAELSQQMPLQALIARAGGYEGVPAAPVAALEYLAFKAKPDARLVGVSNALPATPNELADKAEEGLKRLIANYRQPDTSFLSAPRVKFVKYDNGFNRLARRAEWAGDTEDGEGDNG